MMFVNPEESWSSETDLWIRPTDLSWCSPILVTIRELLFQELPWKITREVEGQRGQDRGGQEAEDLEM